MTREQQILLRFRLHTELDEYTVLVIDHLIWYMRCLNLWNLGTKNTWLHKIASAYFEQLDLEPFQGPESLIAQIDTDINYLRKMRDQTQTYKPNVTLH